MAVDIASFTVGVFKDLEWASRGVEALRRHGFAPEVLSVLAKDTADAAQWAERTLGRPPARLEAARLGSVLAGGSLVEVLQGASRDLAALGVAGTMRRAGFQSHDGQIFESLISKGGLLVAIQDEPRAADALAVLHAYGGGNAAIGAWKGRL